ncbi:MAG: hypothetical protein ABIG68_08275 [Acidobacteriota bacterium]
MVGLLALIPASITLLLCRTAAYALPEADVEIEIRIASLSEAEISGSYRPGAGEGAGATLHHLAVRFPGQEMEILSAESDGTPLVIELTREGSALRAALRLPEKGSGRYRIRYRLRSGKLSRFPLLVPVTSGIGSGGDRSTLVRVHLPESMTLVGDSFPRFEMRAGLWEAALPDLPGFLVLPLKNRRDLGFFDRLFTVGRATNAGLLLFLLGAGAYGVLIRRRGRARGATDRRERTCRPL